jgi:hypothetical protein
MICAIPSNASDNVYCILLAHSAIHGAMVWYSFTVGMVNGRHTYIPFYVSNKLLFYRVKCFSCTLLKFPGTTYLASSVLTNSAGSSFDGRG